MIDRVPKKKQIRNMKNLMYRAEWPGIMGNGQQAYATQVLTTKSNPITSLPSNHISISSTPSNVVQRKVENTLTAPLYTEQSNRNIFHISSYEASPKHHHFAVPYLSSKNVDMAGGPQLVGPASPSISANSTPLQMPAEGTDHVVLSPQNPKTGIVDFGLKIYDRRRNFIPYSTYSKSLALPLSLAVPNL